MAMSRLLSALRSVARAALVPEVFPPAAVAGFAGGGEGSAGTALGLCCVGVVLALLSAAAGG